MGIESLVYQNHPIVTIGTNTFIESPLILAFEGTPLIEIVQEIDLGGYTPKVPIFHPDGTQIAVIKGTRVYLTEEGRKVGIAIDKLQEVTFCKMENQTLFEIRHSSADTFLMYAELYTPEGYFIKYSDNPNPVLKDDHGQLIKALQRTQYSTHKGTGIHVSKNGGIAVY